MARIVKDPEVRRNEILDAAERLMASKGYEQVAIQDIIDELQIAKGTVYHYFDSKVALLMALVERIGEKAKQLVLPIVSDRELSAQDKLVRIFDVLDRYKRANKNLIFSFMRVWYADENALFRNRLYTTRIKWLAPLLRQIIQEGVEEGVFTTPYPDQAARMIIALLEDLGYAIAEILLVKENERFDFPLMVRMGEATADAMERLLGMKSGHLLQAWREDFLRWQELLE
jgi:TetR/AcrR family transcriptional repressor of nem operon